MEKHGDDCLPSLLADKPEGYLSKDEIKTHFVSIGKNLIVLVDDKIVFQSLIQDEIKKLHTVLNNFDKELSIVNALNKYLTKDSDAQTISNAK